MDKLFGNSDNKTTVNNFLQNKLDKLEDFSDGSKSKPVGGNKTNLNSSQSFKKPNQSNTQTQSTSKAQFLPWDLPEAQVGTPPSNKRPTNNTNDIFNTSNGSAAFLSTPPTNTIRRPKETNNIFTSNIKTTNHSNNFIEDIEELTL